MADRDGKNWRELCAAAAKERDSEKLVSLVNQILEAFDKDDGKERTPTAQTTWHDAPTSR